MSDTAKIVAAAVGGYILGRKKKLKLAIGLGLYLGAKKLDIKPQMLAQGLLKEVSSLPLVGELRNQSREQLLDVGKAAAGNLAGKWAGSLADSLNERTESLRSGAGKGAADTVTGGSERSEHGDGAREDDEDTGAPSSEKDSEGSSPDKGGRKAKVRKTAPGRAAAGAAGKAGSGTRKAAQRKRPARKGGEEDGDGRG